MDCSRESQPLMLIISAYGNSYVKVLENSYSPTKNISLLEIGEMIRKQLPVQTELAAHLLPRSGSK
jgi:hypothetical protein